MRSSLEREGGKQQERRREAEPLTSKAQLAHDLGNQRFGELIGRSSAAGPMASRGEHAEDVEVSRALASAAQTRNPGGAGSDEEIVTADPTGTEGGGSETGSAGGTGSGSAGGTGSASAGGSDSGSAGGTPGATTTAPKVNGDVSSGPAYNSAGTVGLITTPTRKSAPFTFGATMKTDALKGTVPGSCSVRQYIRWDKDFADYRGGPPHAGFPSGTAFGTWIEDRDQNDKRYGHRSGPHSDPIAGGGDEYTLAGVQNQADGDVYKGRDTPGGPAAMKGKFDFQLKAIDTNNGDAVKGQSSVITVAW
jgi:hypothetical protein